MNRPFVLASEQAVFYALNVELMEEPVENPVNCPQRTPLEAFKARKNVASRSHPRILL